MAFWAAAFPSHAQAIRDHVAVIELRPDGTVTSANARFLAMLDYQSEDLIGRNHAILVEPGERESTAYRDFWHGLRRGEPGLQEVRRTSATGR